ncbi:hypothetical protein JCM10908_006656 [Rhodotorula pacifica]|uniref:SH3 domain-containing protein n=1 Tax=Rhodotorula pacifica TaxID=1495444 RepID=UPI003172EEF8
MAASVPSSGSLITHLVSRIESDLSFLASHNLVTPAELSQIRSTLSEAQVRANGAAMELLAIRNDPAVVAGSTAAGGVGMVPVAPTVQQGANGFTPPKQQCKAIWDYNKSQPDDLGFKAGDIITIEHEENPDWWRGSLNGQSGLFPSNHVERLPPSASSVPAPPPRKDVDAASFSSQQPPNPSWSPSPVPAPPHSPYAYQQPQHYGGAGVSSTSTLNMNEKQQPQQWNGIPSYAQAPPPQPQPPQQVVVQPGGAPAVPGKKHKLGGLGKTVGTAFAGGLGFGAGTAIASDAINAIF